MLRTSLTASLLVALAGCASPPLYGNFLERTTVQSQSFFALDAAAQLRRAYSPAAMPLVVPGARDPFGRALVTRLRHMGFAVSDEGSAPAPGALIVRYVVDGIGAELYRVTLVIWRARDSALLSRMSRAYGKQAGVLHAAGAWTRQAPVEEGAQAWTTN